MVQGEACCTVYRRELNYNCIIHVGVSEVGNRNMYVMVSVLRVASYLELTLCDIE